MKFATWTTLAVIALAACGEGKDPATDTDPIDTDTETNTETGDTFVEVPTIEAFGVFVQGGYIPAPPQETDVETETETETETDVETDTDAPDTDTDAPDTDTDVVAVATLTQANLQPTGSINSFTIDGTEFPASIGFELGTEAHFFNDAADEGCVILVALPDGTATAPWTDDEDALFGFTFDPETATFETDCDTVFAPEEAQAYLENFVQGIEWRFGLHRSPGTQVSDGINGQGADAGDFLGLGLATEAFADPGPTLENYDNDYGYGYAYACDEDMVVEIDGDEAVEIPPADLVTAGDLQRSVLTGRSYFIYSFN